MDHKKTGTILISLSMALLLGGCGADKHVTEYTPENYYLYAEAMKSAGYKKRISTAYINNTDKVFTSVQELKENVKPSDMPSVLECDYKEKTCDAYYLGEGDTKVGNVRYIYRYNSTNMRISKSGNDVFTEYTYDKGRLSSIIDYQGSEKSASSEVIRSMTFGYNNQNKATYIKGFDTTTETKSNFDYTLEYDVQGRLVKINAMLNGAVGSYTVLTYREDGLLSSSATYGITESGENLLSYYEFTYE
ncbi:MAG: hypothetical protein E7185_00380 [Erysipelotrichaceae bacterium]|nr:hypothetical protein [Erysipelotrichaceae bacterium]